MSRLRRLITAAWRDPFTRWMGVVLLVAGVLRVAWVLYAAREPVGLHDPFWYELGATRIANGDGYTLLSGDPTAYYPIGYPAALAVVVWLTANTPIPDNVPVAAGMLNVVLGVATVGMIGVLGRRLLGARVGIVAAAVVAVFPNQIFYTATMLSETLFNTLLVSALLVLVWSRDRVSPWPRVLVAGVLLGFAVLTRPVALAVLPFVGLAWWIGRTGWRRALTATLVLAAGVVLVILPWTIRNVVRMGEPVLISTNTGDNLCIGHSPEANGAFRIPSEEPGDSTDSCFADVPGRVTTEDELRRDRTLRSRAVEYAVDHPRRELSLLWWRAYYTFYLDDDGLSAVESYQDDRFLGDRQRAVLETFANGAYFGVLALALLGIPALWDRRDRRRLLYLGFLAAMATPPLVIFGDPRFKVPFALLCVLPAAITLTAVASIRRSALSGS